MWLLSFVSDRGSLQWDPSIIWLRPGALGRAPASPRSSILHRISGVHAVGNVTGSTSTSMSHVNCVSQPTVLLLLLSHLPPAALLLFPGYCIVLHCPLSTHHPTLLAALTSHSVRKSCCSSVCQASSTVCVLFLKQRQDICTFQVKLFLFLNVIILKKWHQRRKDLSPLSYASRSASVWCNYTNSLESYTLFSSCMVYIKRTGHT